MFINIFGRSPFLQRAGQVLGLGYERGASYLTSSIRVVTSRRLQPLANFRVDRRPRRVPSSASALHRICERVSERQRERERAFTRSYPGLGWTLRANETYCGAGDNRASSLDACDVLHEKLQVRAVRLVPRPASSLLLPRVPSPSRRDSSGRNCRHHRRRRILVHAPFSPPPPLLAAIVMKLRRRSPRARLKRPEFSPCRKTAAEDLNCSRTRDEGS